MLRVGSKFFTFDDLSTRLEEFQRIEQVQLWVRDSRTVVAAAKRARRKSLNPALKYAELTYSCVFGGRRPSDQTKTHNQTSAGGCPFKVRLSTSNDGQALVVKEICHDHNHEPGKKLHEEPRRLYKNKNRSSGGVKKPVRSLVNKRSSGQPAATTVISVEPSHSDSIATSARIQITHPTYHHAQMQSQQYQLKLRLDSQQREKNNVCVTEFLQLDSPDRIDTPDHLRSCDLSGNFEGHFMPLTAEQYSYLPPSPISPSTLSNNGNSSSSSSSDEDAVEPIVDLDVALEEALGSLDSIDRMDLDDKCSYQPFDPCCPPPTPVDSASASDGEPSFAALPATAPGSQLLSLKSVNETLVESGEKNLYLFDGENSCNDVTDIPDLDLSYSDLMQFDVTLF